MAIIIFYDGYKTIKMMYRQTIARLPESLKHSHRTTLLFDILHNSRLIELKLMCVISSVKILSSILG